ncbi:hypothetical protein FPANT_7172 [Fusarium pseudoanthophilum]|uniref:Copper-fist domain-containing protein n=1 Tax=Fusarium pseudoanthophilum TaxID=48495 RepID=A0A8H5L8G9_9HYPO|nr:hypothetical protein FPANT_7172 [Fusarium pseudoanthophilum]
MRTNERGEKIACVKCRVGHRTGTCVDKTGHQDDVQVVNPPGRPIGAKTDPVRAARKRDKRRSPTKVELGRQGAADLQPLDLFCPDCEVAGPVQGRFAAGYQQLPFAGYQNPGSFMNPPALVPSPAQPSGYLPDPLYAGLPAPAWQPLGQPAHLGMGLGPAPPLPAVPAPTFVSSAPVFQPVVANQWAAMPQNGWVDNPSMSFPQVDMAAQVQQGGNMMIPTLPGDLMGAGNIAPFVPSVPSAPFVPTPSLSSSDEEARGVTPWDEGPSPEQPVQPTLATNSDAQSPDSPSSPEPKFSYLDHLQPDGYFPGQQAALGTLADQGASASPGQDPFADFSLPVADPSTGGDLYCPGEECDCSGEESDCPGEEYGLPVETAGDFSHFSFTIA